ncbi:MAG: hypothetical protein AB3X44_16255 [Leptothrix sp. (in: b-proteobacteria)]
MLTLEKRSYDSRRFDIDCSQLLSTGETVTSVTSIAADQATTPALAFGTGTVNGTAITYPDGHTAPIGTVVQVQISGGQVGVTYTVRAKFATSQSPNVLDATVLLRVNDYPT